MPLQIIESGFIVLHVLSLCMPELYFYLTDGYLIKFCSLIFFCS